MRRSTLVLLLAIGIVAGACASAGAPILSTVGNSVGAEQGAAPQPAPTAAPAAGSDTSGYEAAARDNAKIIRTGTLSLQVDDLPAALKAGRDAIDRLGGFVGASRESNSDDQPTAQITYRIPVDRWDEALTILRGQARKVIEEATDSEEVTTQLVDLGARIRNLRASEDSLIAIAARAEKISDVLEVQSRLTEVRGQIEQLEAQRTSLEDRVAFATLRVNYGLEVAAVKEIAKGFSPEDEVDRASAQLIGIVQSVTAAGIWFAIVWLPILLVLIVFAFIVFRVARRIGLRPPRANPATGWGSPPAPPAPPGAPGPAAGD